MFIDIVKHFEPHFRGKRHVIIIISNVMLNRLSGTYSQQRTGELGEGEG